MENETKQLRKGALHYLTGWAFDKIVNEGKRPDDIIPELEEHLIRLFELNIKE